VDCSTRSTPEGPSAPGRRAGDLHRTFRGPWARRARGEKGAGTVDDGRGTLRPTSGRPEPEGSGSYPNCSSLLGVGGMSSVYRARSWRTRGHEGRGQGPAPENLARNRTPAPAVPSVKPKSRRGARAPEHRRDSTTEGPWTMGAITWVLRNTSRVGDLHRLGAPKTGRCPWIRRSRSSAPSAQGVELSRPIAALIQPRHQAGQPADDARKGGSRSPTSGLALQAEGRGRAGDGREGTTRPVRSITWAPEQGAGQSRADQPAERHLLARLQPFFPFC